MYTKNFKIINSLILIITSAVSYLGFFVTRPMQLQPKSLKTLCTQVVGQNLKRMYQGCDNLQELEEKVQSFTEQIPAELEPMLAREFDKLFGLQCVNTKAQRHPEGFHPKDAEDIITNLTGTHLAVCARDSALYSLASKKYLDVFGSTFSQEARVSFSSSGKYFAGVDRAKIRLWSLEAEKQLEELWDHKNVITGLDFAQQSDVFLSSSCDGTVKVWDIYEKQYIAELDHQAPINSAFFCNDIIIATAGDDEKIKFWDWQNGDCILDIEAGRCLMFRDAARSKLVAVEDPVNEQEESRRITVVNFDDLSSIRLVHENRLSDSRTAIFNSLGTHFLLFEKELPQGFEFFGERPHVVQTTLWDLKQSRRVDTFLLGSSEKYIEDMAVFTPEGTHLIIGNGFGSFSIINLDSYELMYSYQFPVSESNGTNISSCKIHYYPAEFCPRVQICFDSAGRYLYFYSQPQSKMFIFDLVMKKYVGEFFTHEFILKVTPSSKYMIRLDEAFTKVSEFADSETIKEAMLHLLTTRLMKGKLCFSEKWATLKEIKSETSALLKSSFLKDLPKGIFNAFIAKIYGARKRADIYGLQDLFWENIYYLDPEIKAAIITIGLEMLQNYFA